MKTSSLGTIERIRERGLRTAVHLVVEGVRRAPALRERMMGRVSQALARSYLSSYDNPENLDLLAHYFWFGRSLKPFLARLLRERPRAAEKLVYLAYIWARDVRRRRQSEEAGMVAPVTAVLEPTGRCNLRCPGCYANSGPVAKDLPYEVWRDVVAEVRDMGVTLVTLTGGEPFMREAEDRMITRLAAEFPNMGFLVYTNATMITEDIAKRLGEVGNVFPGISTEGYERESDARRGVGYSRNAGRVREILARYEVMYGFSATVTRANAELLASDEFIDSRIAQGDMFGWYFLFQPIGRNPDISLLVTPEQRAFLREQICKWRCQGKPIFLGDFWNDGLFTKGCIAGGRGYFHIYSNGDISPCVFAPVAVGNVMDIRAGRSPYRSLTDLVNRHPFFVAFRQKQKEITDYRAPCPLLDHPEKLRDVCAHAEWFAASNMVAGYLDGEIARALDTASTEWRKKLQHTPRLPEAVQQQVNQLREELRSLRDGQMAGAN